MHLQSRLDTYFNKDTHRTVLYFLVYDQDKEKQKDFKNVMSFRGKIVSFNPIMVDSYAAFFNCTPVGRASDSMMAPT